MNPIETDAWFGGKKRPPWAGNVVIKQEAIPHVRLGTIVRTTEVIGIVAPGKTSGRPSAPEPSSGILVSTANKVPSKYHYDAQTGANAYNTGFIDAEKGHIMALELGGPDIPENIVPQWAKWQGSGVWRRMEEEVCALAEQGLASKTAPFLLMFHAVVLYPSNVKVKWAGMRRVCTPKGFRVGVTKLDPKTRVPIGGPTYVFDAEQSRNETDDMLAMRAFARVDGDDFAYEDWTETKKRGKSKGVFAETGQDPRYTPPPIHSTATAFDLSAYMQQHGIGVGLDGKVSLDDDEEWTPQKMEE